MRRLLSQRLAFAKRAFARAFSTLNPQMRARVFSPSAIRYVPPALAASLFLAVQNEKSPSAPRAPAPAPAPSKDDDEYEEVEVEVEEEEASPFEPSRTYVGLLCLCISCFHSF